MANFEVYVSEITEEGKLYACNISDGPALETLMDRLRTEFSTNPPIDGTYTPKKGDICAAKFVDDQWYRAKIERISENKVYVQYIDYGNSAYVQKIKLRALPATFTELGAFAKLYSIALVSLPQDKEHAARGLEVLRDDILDKTVKLKVQYKIGRDTFVSIHIADEDVGKNMVEDGLLLVDRQGAGSHESPWFLVKEYEQVMEYAKENHLNIWRYGDITQGDTMDFGAAASSSNIHDHKTVSKSKKHKKKKRNKSGLSEPYHREFEPCKGEIESKKPGTDEDIKEGDGNICQEVEQDKLALSSLRLDSIEDPNIQALKDELVFKEAKLGELWERSQVFVESKGSEMSALVSAVEDAEEEKHMMLKQVTKLEGEMNNIRDQLAIMQERKEQLIKDVEEKDDLLKELLKKKKQLEDLIETEVDANKHSKRKLEKEIGSLQTRIGASTKEEANISHTIGNAKLEAKRFLLNINKKIEAKESDLECPVCLEVSTAPIYSCDEQHIICSDCRPKVSIYFQGMYENHTAHVSGLSVSRVQGALP